MDFRCVFSPRSTLGALAASGVVALACAASAQHIPQPERMCPEEISVDQSLKVPLPGWQVQRARVRTALDRILLHDGHPSELASLVPDREEARAGGRLASVWELQPSLRGYWVACAYRHTDVTISRRLQENFARCEFVTDPGRSISGAAPIVDSRCE